MNTNSSLLQSYLIPVKLSYRRIPALDRIGRGRYQLTHRITLKPSIAGGLYESAMSMRFDSQSSVYHRLGGLSYLLTWAESASLDIERCLLAGIPLSSSQVNSFAYWLEKRFTDNGRLPRAKRRTFNGIVDAARLTERWFLNFGHFCVNPTERALEIERLVSGQSMSWEQVNRRGVGQEEAPDLTDEHLQTIETILREAALSPSTSHSDQRTYLIWRLIREYGLRIGEVLALRIEDCPRNAGNPLQIVRIEDRKNTDPRGVYAPRPKTRGRSLGTIFTPSTFPSLIWDYVSKHRYITKKNSDGTLRKTPAVPHPFLLVNKKGAPISRGETNRAARKIANAAGFPFRWHLVRHAFFNRAYKDITSLSDESDRTTRMDDLVYWGGWSDPSSLAIYTNRAKRIRAEEAKVAWQSGEKR